MVYFDSIDDVDDEEHNGDFDAFSPGHSQYLTFSFDCDELGGLRQTWQQGIILFDFRCIYSFTRSMSYCS